MIDKDTILSHVSYNPETGIFKWLPRFPGDTHGNKIFNSRFANKRAGTQKPDGYRFICIKGKILQEHQLAWVIMNGFIPKDMLIDHINGKPEDNRYKNLRLATKSQNAINAKINSRNTSGIKGVRLEKGKYWTASIKSNGKGYFLGSFKTKEDAVQARKAAEIKYHKEFSRK